MASMIRISGELVADLGLRARPRRSDPQFDMYSYDRRRLQREMRRVLKVRA
jgi:hypothetical protein